MRIATWLTRLLLLLYPPSFRREMGPLVVDDVRRRARELSGAETGTGVLLWIPRLAMSLVVNGLAAWHEALGGARHSSLLDLKLGVRMLLKHPGLSLASGMGIALVIAVAGGFSAFGWNMISPRIPLDEGERLVGLGNWDVSRRDEERRNLRDFLAWRDELASVRDLAAFRPVQRNLITRDGSVEQIRIAEMSPAGFRAARVPPLLGRTLVEGDAGTGATPALVIGYDPWRRRFASDPDIVGTEVRLGGTTYTVVGVMPRGFHFPLNEDYWTPLTVDPAEHEVLEGPEVFVFGRLAPGYGMEEARAEMAVLGRRMATAHPDTHGDLLAQVLPFAHPLVSVNEEGEAPLAMATFFAAIVLVLLIISVNVAVLIYARTATRRGEIAVRTALGASRGRIVAQLFGEALVLSTGAALVGVFLAKVGLGWTRHIIETGPRDIIPFWFDFGIPGPAWAFIVLLTVLATVITGAVPALQATGGGVQRNLSRYRQGAGPALGRTWTILIVSQVAMAVAGIPVVVGIFSQELGGAAYWPRFPAHRMLVAWMSPEPVPSDRGDEHRGERLARFTEARSEVARRLEAEAGVVDMTFTLSIRAPFAFVALEGGSTSEDSGESIHGVRSGEVAPEFFRLFESSVLSGRAFRSDDRDASGPTVAVVDEAFVRQVMKGADPLGRRVRIVPRSEWSSDAPSEKRWMEIVGVVESVHRAALGDGVVDPVVYRPMPRDPQAGVGLVLRFAGVDAQVLRRRIREVASRVDPTMRVDIHRLDKTYRQDQLAVSFAVLVIALAILAVLLLSAAGVYALMSFTVSQRRREIGIRSALGAHPARLLAGVFRKSVRQLGMGVLLGLVGALAFNAWFDGEVFEEYWSVALAGMALVMMAVGVLATWGPARRGLRIEPAEVLKEE